MTLRHALARWLAPDVFDQADRYRLLLATIDHDHRWLSEFSEIAEVLDRLRCDNPTEISKFRGQLRAQAMRRHVMARRGMVADLAWPDADRSVNHGSFVPATLTVSPTTPPPAPRKK